MTTGIQIRRTFELPCHCRSQFDTRSNYVAKFHPRWMGRKSCLRLTGDHFPPTFSIRASRTCRFKLDNLFRKAALLLFGQLKCRLILQLILLGLIDALWILDNGFSNDRHINRVRVRSLKHFRCNFSPFNQLRPPNVYISIHAIHFSEQKGDL